MTEKPPAGWYPDSTGTVRWWDGEQWTEHQPPPPPPTQAPPAEAAPETSPHGDPILIAAAGSGEPRGSAGNRRAVVETSSQTGEPTGSGKGLAMTALGVAIVSLLLCWIPIVNNAVFFLGLIGLVLAVIAYRRARKGKSEGRGMAFAAILISILSVVGVLATQAFYGSVLDDIGDSISSAGDSGSTPSKSDKERSTKAEIQPIGKSAKVGSEYTVAITKVNLNADDVLARDEFNEPPKRGRFIIMTLDVTYTGEEEGDPWTDLEGTFVGSDARQYDSAACEATVSDSGYDVPTLNSGGKATFKACFDVPPDAIDGGKLFIDELASFNNKSRVYWAIR
jgi:hypothetical protein